MIQNILTNIYTTSEIISIIGVTLGGLGIFLYGIHIMGESLKSIAGSKIKIIIEKTTNTVLKGVLVGIIFTGLIQSSSGTTAIVVGLVSAGLMTLKQGICVIMGANIGTTVTALIIGLDVGNLAPFFIAIGAMLIFFTKNKKVNYIGQTILGFGLLFFGLEMMGDELKELSKLPVFESIFTSMSNNSILGLFTGAGLTAIIQSSSASIGITQKLYEAGSITLKGAIPLLIGANIGTTITAILSSIGTSSGAKRAALAHVIFNLIGAVLFIIILVPFTNLIQYLEINASFLISTKASTLALAHVIFNVATTVIMLFFVNLLVKLVEKIIPRTAEENLIGSIDKLQPSLIEEAPELALENIHVVMNDMFEIVNSMFVKTKSYYILNDNKLIKEVKELEEIIDTYDEKLHDHIIKLSASTLTQKQIKFQSLYLDTIRDLERIGDHCSNLCEFMEERYSNNKVFYHESGEMVNDMFDKINKMVSDSKKSFNSIDLKAARRVKSNEPLIDEIEKKYRKRETELIALGELKHVSLNYVDILSNLERIGDHTNNIAGNVIELEE